MSRVLVCLALTLLAAALPSLAQRRAATTYTPVPAEREDLDAKKKALAERLKELTGKEGVADAAVFLHTAEIADELRLYANQGAVRNVLHGLEIGLTNEFVGRRDGWPRLRQVYGFSDAHVRGMQHELAYRALRSGGIAATDLYSTDAEIQASDLVVLEDDRRAFPRYDAVLLRRSDLPDAAGRALARLEGAISAREMIAMNARALIERVPEAQVVSDFLRTKLGIASSAASRGALRRIAGRTAEHLFLVAVSLAAAIALAIPLGVFAWRHARIGEAILALAGVIQTIPSLALLVFMIPLLGIGAGPAIVALFLYSLLPILRGTHAGLAGIAPELRESAEALGLPRSEVLRRIELPLAAPSILSGIKTAAVIDVGTATLGALIGAGGYGQSILTGIRLADTGLILEGAIPAGVMALAVQGAFDLIERALVPRGLRNGR